MTIRIVVISLCDNDFGQTFIPLLAAVRRFLEYDPDADPEVIEGFIRDAAPAFYWAYQGWYGSGESKEVDVEKTGRYLLERVKVLFNEEAEREMAQDHDGGSWYLVVESGQIGRF